MLNEPRRNDDSETLIKFMVNLRPIQSGGWPPVDAEWLWGALLSKLGVEVRSSPFYAFGFSCEDIVAVRVVQDGDDEWYEYERVLEHRGHSTYRLFVFDGATSESFLTLWKKLADLGCTYEGADEKLIAVDIPPGVDIKYVYTIMKEGESLKIWDFEECYYFAPPSLP